MPEKYIIANIIPAHTGRKFNVAKTFRRRPGRFLNVLCTFNLRPVATGIYLYIDRTFEIGFMQSVMKVRFGCT